MRAPGWRPATGRCSAPSGTPRTSPRPRCPAARPSARRRRRARGRARSRAGPSRLLLEQRRQVLVEPALGDRAAPQRGHAAVAVDEERLGIGAHAVLAAVLAVAVAQAGERDPLLAQEAQRILLRLLRVDAQDDAAL